MGCIPSKQRKKLSPKNNHQLPPFQPSTNNKMANIKDQNLLTMASTENKEKNQSTLISSISKLNNFCPPQSSLLVSNLTANKASNLTVLRVQGPQISKELIKLICEQQHLSLCMQMQFGYPSENITWLSNFTMGPNEECIEKSGLFILEQKVNVFCKIRINCKKCSKITNFTTCKTVFCLPSNLCQCQDNGIKLTINKLMPSYSQIWLDCVKESIFESESMQINERTKENRLRIIGCTSCWKFQNLKQRKLCNCGICENCDKDNYPCQVCE